MTDVPRHPGSPGHDTCALDVLAHRGTLQVSREPRLELVHRERPAQQVALCHVTAHLGQRYPSSVESLHAFGDDAKIEAVAEVDDRANDRRSASSVGDPAHEGTINLDFVDRQRAR